LEGGAAEGEWFEELGDGAAIGLGIEGCASWGDLCRGVVGDLALVSNFLPRYAINVIGIHQITYALCRLVWDSGSLLFVCCWKSMMRRHLVEALETTESQRATIYSRLI